MEKVFQSKVDTWLVLFIIVVFAIPIGSALKNYTSSTDLAIIAGISLPILILVFSLLYRTSYTVRGNFLIVKYGFVFHEEYNIEKITKIRRTRSPLAAPAPSMDRIAVHFVKKRTPLILSPKDKHEFAACLHAVNPHIKIEY